jgi:RimJ/RimL family protein N-acetyltransferase
VADGAFVLSTPRLTMRRWRSSDLEPFAAMNADPQVMRYFPAPLDRAASDAFVARIESRFDELGYGLWALELSASGKFIGFTGLNPMPDGVPGAGGTEVGWRLARSAWGKGYATEAGQAALDMAFTSIGLREVWSLTAKVNTPSVAVMRRLGLSYVGSALHPALDPTSSLAPHVFYRIRAAEYRAAEM